VCVWLREESGRDRNVIEYAWQLKDIRVRLSANESKFFGNVSLHDGTLLSFSVGDALESTENGLIKKRQTKVKIIVKSAENGSIYTLNYSGIHRCSVDFPSATPLFYKPGDPFDDWGYDELTDAGNGLYQHEILFASGATISIIFQRFSYQIKLPQKQRSV